LERAIDRQADTDYVEFESSIRCATAISPEALDAYVLSIRRRHVASKHLGRQLKYARLTTKVLLPLHKEEENAASPTAGEDLS
jgi:hypothetical protein